MGDPTKIVLLDAVLKVIKRENLLSVVEKSGDVLMSGLRDLEAEFPALINATRGRGTFITFDATDAKLRDDIVKRLLTKGILIILYIDYYLVYILYVSLVTFNMGISFFVFNYLKIKNYTKLL